MVLKKKNQGGTVFVILMNPLLQVISFMPKKLCINSKKTKPKGPVVFRMFLSKPLTQITRKNSMCSVNNEILNLGLTRFTMIKNAPLYVRT